MPHGWLTNNEKQALRTLCEGRRVLEIGAWQGLSACTIGAVSAGLASMDHWQGDADTRRVAGEISRGNLLDKYLTAVEEAGVQPVMLIGDSQHLLDVIDPAAFEVVFYDADHAAGPTLHAVRWAAKGCRHAIAVHDYKPRRYKEACAALDQWQQDQDITRVLVDSLAIYFRTSDDAATFEKKLGAGHDKRGTTTGEE